jgi:hypothetical protein
MPVLDTATGDSHETKPPKNFRFGFNNINGLPLSPASLQDFIGTVQDLQLDWVGIAETHLDTTKPHVRETFKSKMQSNQGFLATNCVFAASDISFGIDRKRGGVLQMAVGNLATRTIKQHTDPYGRFTSQTHTGQDGMKLTTISAYRVCGGSQQGPSSAYAQQRAMLVTQNRPANPRAVFIEDLIAYIQECQLQGHEILLCLDANETIERATSGLRRLATMCSLSDVHEILHPHTALPSHRRGSGKIDFILASPRVLSCITQAGILALDDGFGSDHRLLFIDVAIDRLFKGVTADPVSVRNRNFTTKNKKRTNVFLEAIQLEWTRRNLSNRVKIVQAISNKSPNTINRPKLQQLWDKIDSEIGHALDKANQTLQQPKRRQIWSPAVARAGEVKRYWKARISNVLAGLDGRIALNKKASKLGIHDDLTEDITELESRYDSAVATFSQLASTAQEQRNIHLDGLISNMEPRPDKQSKATLQALKSVKMAETQLQLFKKLRQTLRPMTGGPISKVTVPHDMAVEVDAFVHQFNTSQISTSHSSTLENILQHTIRHKRSTNPGESWDTIIDKDKLETSILMYCHQHFQQAKQTPFGTGPLAEAIGTDGLSALSDRILQGTLFERPDYEIFPELRSFILQFTMPEIIKSRELIPSDISLKQYRKAINTWRESTSTSPSGRHLGMYKALLSSTQITADMCAMLNIVTRHGLVPGRWCKAISVLLEKDPGSPDINRLRVIHIFEADYNIFLKIMWARRLVQRGEETKQFGESQQGSRSGRTANDAVLLKRLTYDITRILRSNLGTFDNDAKSCYDRIINGLAMLAARRLGMPDSAIRTHAGVLAQMQYAIKTSYGVSTLFIQSMVDAFLYGTGQGSGASPAIWLTLSVILLNSLKVLIPRGMKFENPSSTLVSERHSDAFVDDAQNGVNDTGEAEPWSLERLQMDLQKMSQTWEKLLFSSGGALELKKCFYYLIHWQWIHGLPRITPAAQMTHLPSIKLTSGRDVDEIAITQKDATEAHKTLGVYMTPTGDESAQVAALTEKSCRISNLVLSSRFTKLETIMAYRTMWFPAVGYSLGVTAMSKSQLRSIQSMATQSFLAKMGLNRNYPRAVTFGPPEYGGLAFPDLYVEQGVQQIRTVMEHIYHSTEAGKLIQICLQSLQAEAGSAVRLLQDPTTEISYLTPCWLTTLRSFMRKHQLSLEMTENWNFTLSRERDEFLMDKFRQSGHFFPKELLHLNSVRLYLQVATIADIATADGQSICATYMLANPCTHRRSRWSWSRQPTISQHQRDLWRRALRLTLLCPTSGVHQTNSENFGRLRDPVGAWVFPPNQVWSCYYDSRRECLYTSVEGSQGNIHYKHQSKGRPKRFCSQFATNSDAIKTFQYSSSMVPAEVRSTQESDFILGSYAKSKQTSNPRIPMHVDYKSYIKALPPERRRLMSWNRPWEGMSLDQSIKKLKQSILRNGRLDTGTDGGLMDRSGSFGCVIADDKQPLWICAGPADMDASTANSSRPELAGYAGLWETLLMLVTVYPSIITNQDIEIRTWIDSTSALRRLTHLRSQTSRHRSYPADADLSSHVRWLWSQLPAFTPSLQWVKAHQDDRATFTSLPHSAKLNIIADNLATTYLQQTAPTFRPRNNPLFFPSSKISLLVNGQRITTKYSSYIRFHINGTLQRRYLQQRQPEWQSDRVWILLDMEGFGLAFRMLDVTARLSVSKMTHGWYNTGHQRAKIHKSSSSQCPSCHGMDETLEHILRCPEGKVRAARYRASVKLRATIVTKCGSSKTWSALHKGLLQWLDTGQPVDTAILSEALLEPQQVAITKAINDQNLIGWSYALRGYLATSWVLAYSIEHPTATLSQLRNSWLRHIIRAIWTFVDTMWKHRNEVLHSQAHNKPIVESAINSQIRYFYDIQDKFAATDRVLFDIPLEARLASSLQSRKHWLTLIKRYQETTQTRQTGQQDLITKFFTRATFTSTSTDTT